MLGGAEGDMVGYKTWWRTFVRQLEYLFIGVVELVVSPRSMAVG